MTDTTTETPSEAQTEERVPEAQHDENSRDDPGDRGAREAKKYRQRAQAAEAERDELRQLVELHQRRAIEQYAAEHLAQPSDLFTITGATVADLIDDTGDVDAEKLQVAVRDLLEQRPGLHKDARVVRPDLGQGERGERSAGMTWSEALKNR